MPSFPDANTWTEREGKEQQGVSKLEHFMSSERPAVNMFEPQVLAEMSDSAFWLLHYFLLNKNTSFNRRNKQGMARRKNFEYSLQRGKEEKKEQLRKKTYSNRLQKAQLLPESATLKKTEKLSKNSVLAPIKSTSVTATKQDNKETELQL